MKNMSFLLIAPVLSIVASGCKTMSPNSGVRSDAQQNGPVAYESLSLYMTQDHQSICMLSCINSGVDKNLVPNDPQTCSAAYGSSQDFAGRVASVLQNLDPGHRTYGPNDLDNFVNLIKTEAPTYTLDVQTQKKFAVLLGKLADTFGRFQSPLDPQSYRQNGPNRGPSALDVCLTNNTKSPGGGSNGGGDTGNSGNTTAGDSYGQSFENDQLGLTGSVGGNSGQGGGGQANIGGQRAPQTGATDDYKNWDHLQNTPIPNQYRPGSSDRLQNNIPQQ